jgi:NitT/TauT family transport system substrate-binding protein
MAARSGVTPAEYETFVNGTNFLTLEESAKVYVKAEGFKSLYGSTKFVNDFNLANKVYPKAEKVDSYIDSSFYPK